MKLALYALEVLIPISNNPSKRNPHKHILTVIVLFEEQANSAIAKYRHREIGCASGINGPAYRPGFTVILTSSHNDVDVVIIPQICAVRYPLIYRSDQVTICGRNQGRNPVTGNTCLHLRTKQVLELHLSHFWHRGTSLCQSKDCST